MLIDTHAHLHFPQYSADTIENILERAAKNGVERIINIATDLESTVASINLANKYPNIYATAGIHPHDAAAAIEDSSQITQLEKLLQKDKVVAVGEIGLDYFKNYCPADIQKKVFGEILELAVKYNKPVIIHNRDADNDTLELLNHYHPEKVVFHCYSSSVDFAKKILERGYYLSFTGNITFPKNTQGQEVVKYAPLDRIMVETDCPFLTPVPHRGQTNEPAYVKYVAEKIAELKNITIVEIAENTTRNAREFFTFN